MKILVISAAFPPMRAGESDHALHLCQNLASRGSQVDVLTTKGTLALDNPSITSYPIMEKWTWREFPRLARVMKRAAPDGILLIYTGWLYNHPMITFAPTFSHRLLPDSSFVTQFEIAHAANEAGFLFRAVRKGAKHLGAAKDVNWGFGTLLRDSDAIICLSGRHQDAFIEQLPAIKEKSIVIPPPPIMNMSLESGGRTRLEGRAKLGVGPDDFLIAFFGYVYPNKGIEGLFQALAIVARKKANVRLVMIGGSDDFQDEGSYGQSLVKLAAELGIGEVVKWTGSYDSESDFASVCLRSADACVLPFSEGITLNRSSFAAAVAHGLPTITTKGTPIEPQFVDGENVLLCPPDNPEAIAKTLDRLIDSPDLQRHLRAGAFELAHEWFSWDKAIERTVGALRPTR